MRHLAASLIALVAVGAMAGSCTVDASLATDRAGKVVSVQALRLASTMKRVTLAVAVDDGGPVLQFLWQRTVEPQTH